MSLGPSRNRAAAALLGLVFGLLVLLASAPAALAGAPPVTPGHSPQPATPAPAVAPERVKLTVSGAGGNPLFALIGRRIAVNGQIAPYVRGQRAVVNFYLGARRVGAKVLHVAIARDGSGRFTIPFASRYAGTARIQVSVHVAPGVVVSAHAPAVQYVHGDLSPGSSGASVRLLQSELNRLHYAVPLSGVFDEGTGRALVAYRKVTGLERVAEAGSSVFRKLAHGRGAFHVHYRRDGRHVEANLTKQVLAEIEPGGRVRAIYTMSSGKPSTPTVVGHFQVYSKTLGVNAKGMVDSNYFIRGYAIHGYAEVPTYAASHGCLRVPIPDAASIYSWVGLGTPVDVYDEGGGGSTHLRGSAGP